MGRALEASINSTATAVLAAVGAPGTTGQGGGGAASTPAAPGGGAAGAAAVQIPLSAETPAEAMSAAALIDVLLQLFPPGGSAAASPAQHGPIVQLVAPALRAMAALLAHPAVPSAGLNVKIINIFEGFLEVLGRLWLLSPMTFPELVAGLDVAQAQAAAAVAAAQAANGGAGGGAGTGAGAVEGGAVERLLDRWLTIAAARFLEEVVGEWAGGGALKAGSRHMGRAGPSTLLAAGRREHWLWACPCCYSSQWPGLASLRLLAP